MAWSRDARNPPRRRGPKRRRAFQRISPGARSAARLVLTYRTGRWSRVGARDQHTNLGQQPGDATALTFPGPADEPARRRAPFIRWRR